MVYYYFPTHQLNCFHTLRRKHSKKPSPSSKNKLLAAEHKFQALASAPSTSMKIN